MTLYPFRDYRYKEKVIPHFVPNYMGDPVNNSDPNAIKANKENIVQKLGSDMLRCDHYYYLGKIIDDMIKQGTDIDSDDNLMFQLLCILIKNKNKHVHAKFSDIIAHVTSKGEYAGNGCIDDIITTCLFYGWYRSMRLIIENTSKDLLEFKKYLEYKFSEGGDFKFCILQSGSLDMISLMQKYGIIKNMYMDCHTTLCTTLCMEKFKSMVCTLLAGGYDLKYLEVLNRDYYLRVDYREDVTDGNEQLIRAVLSHRLNDILDIIPWPAITEEMIKSYTCSKRGVELPRVSIKLQKHLIAAVKVLPVPLESKIAIAKLKLTGASIQSRILLDRLLRS